MKQDQNLISLFSNPIPVRHDIIQVVNKRAEQAKATDSFIVVTKSEHDALHCATGVPTDRPLKKYKGCVICLVSD